MERKVLCFSVLSICSFAEETQAEVGPKLKILFTIGWFGSVRFGSPESVRAKKPLTRTQRHHHFSLYIYLYGAVHSSLYISPAIYLSLPSHNQQAINKEASQVVGLAYNLKFKEVKKELHLSMTVSSFIIYMRELICF